MSAQSHFAVAGHTDRRGSEAAHRDARLVQGGDTGEHGCAQRGGGRRRQRTAGEDRAQRRALVRLDRDPDSVGVRAPCEDGREGGMAVLGQPLDAGHGSSCFGGGRADLVDHGRLAVLEHGLPPLAGARRYEFDQLRLGLALRHNGCMVTLRHMAYVIVQPCVGVKDASCVEVCPVDCIHTDDAATMYFIDPDECIDCGACVDPCPVDAIFPEDEVPEQWREYIKINADYFKNRQ
jgi:ferredoxin